MDPLRGTRERERCWGKGFHRRCTKPFPLHPSFSLHQPLFVQYTYIDHTHKHHPKKSLYNCIHRINSPMYTYITPKEETHPNMSGKSCVHLSLLSSHHPLRSSCVSTEFDWKERKESSSVQGRRGGVNQDCVNHTQGILPAMEKRNGNTGRHGGGVRAYPNYAAPAQLRPRCHQQLFSRLNNQSLAHLLY